MTDQQHGLQAQRHKPRVIHNHSQLDTCTAACPLNPDYREGSLPASGTSPAICEACGLWNDGLGNDQIARNRMEELEAERDRLRAALEEIRDDYNANGSWLRGVAKEALAREAIR